MDVAIIGGSGLLGTQIFIACKLENHTVCSVSRNSKITFDWTNASTFSNLDAFDVIINAAPVHEIPLYFEFVKNILNQKQAFIETTANPILVQEILTFQTKYSNQSKGLFIHGAGIFPGISNFLFLKALEKHPNPSIVRFNVKYNIFSKAGKDMCLLMAQSLTKPSIFYQNSDFNNEKPIGPIHTFKNKKNDWKGFLADLPDTRYFAKLCPSANFIGSYFTPLPDFLFPVLKAFNFAPKSNLFVKIYASCFYFLRGIIL
jgi:hypothetical protein